MNLVKSFFEVNLIGFSYLNKLIFAWILRLLPLPKIIASTVSMFFSPIFHKNNHLCFHLI